MDQQAPQTKPGGGTSDVTIMIVVFVLVTIGILAGFYFLMYKPKTEDIQSMNAQRDAKTNTLRQYITEAKDLYNYYDRLEILKDQWTLNKKYYVLGDVESEGIDPRDYQWAIFDAYEEIFEMGDYAGVNIMYLKVAEAFKYYMHDEPWELPWELLQFEWDVVFSERGGAEEGVEATTQEATAMITAHTFTAVMRTDYPGLKRFIEVVQNMEGDVKKLVSVHCFAITEEPSYFSFPVSFRGTGGRVLTDVTIEVEMLLTFYELNEKGTAGAVPDIPGQTACSFGGGGRGGRGGGGPSGGSGTGTMSMG